MNQLSHSELRHRILIILSSGPAVSISELARTINTLRPSVSRAVKSLEGAGLLVRNNHILNLTEAGQEAVKDLNASLASKVRKTSDLATRILESIDESQKDLEKLENSPSVREVIAMQNSASLAAMKTLGVSGMMDAKILGASAMMDTLKAGAMVDAGKMLDLGTMVDAFKMLDLGTMVDAKLLETSVIVDAFKAFSHTSAVEAAITATAQIQAINLNWLQTWTNNISVNQNHLLLANNAHLSGIMVDLEAIGNVIMKPSPIFDDLIYRTISSTRAYESYFKDVASRFNPASRDEVLKSAFITPTTATSALVTSARGVIESQSIFLEEEQAHQPRVTKVIVHSEQYVTLITQLIERLRLLGERFSNKWEGAWQALSSDNVDRHSQVTHSARELLMQVLAYLAPNEIFTKEECAKHNVKTPNRKMRIKRILATTNEHSINLIDSFADTLDNMYHVLTGEAHRRDDQFKSDQIITALLVSLGSFLVMLLDWQNQAVL